VAALLETGSDFTAPPLRPTKLSAATMDLGGSADMAPRKIGARCRRERENA
jgi:hypothetical protein